MSIEKNRFFLPFGISQTFSAIYFLCIVFITNNLNPINIRISYRLFYKYVPILSILKAPNIHDNIYTITHLAPS